MNKQNHLQEIKIARRTIASTSIRAFAMIYGPEYVTFEASMAHQEIYALSDSMFLKRKRKTVIAGPRNFGKTTTVTTLNSSYAVCYGKEKFILICSNTSAQAQEKVDNIRKFLTGNPSIMEDFPELFGPNKKLPTCTKEEIITANGIRIMAAGFQQKIRGLGHGPFRPTLVILDDLDSESHSRNFEQKNKIKDWFLGTLLRIGDENTNYIMVGNIFHRHSVIGDLCSDKDHHDWEKFIYRALINFPKETDMWTKCWNISIKTEEFEGEKGPDAARKFYLNNKVAMDEDSLLLWPDRYNLFDIMLEYYRDPATFYAELQNQPRESASDDLNPEFFQYWDKSFKNREELIQFLGGNDGEYYAACDPSTGIKGVRGDNSAIVVVGVKNKIVYVIHESIRRRSIDDLIKDIFALCKIYKFRSFGIEVTGNQEYFYKMLTDKASEEGISCNFVKIPNTTDKLSRISTMAPALREGTLQLSRMHHCLLDEATDFPFCRHDDGLDALQMAFQLTKGNGFMCWFEGSSREQNPKLGGINPRTGSYDPNLPVYGNDDKVPYGWWGFNRRQ